MLDLTLQYNIDNVAELIASKDDSRNRQLRVTVDGMAYLSDIVGNRETEGLSFRLETWQAGNGYVGEKAARNVSWVERIYKVLNKNWPNPTMDYIDVF